MLNLIGIENLAAVGTDTKIERWIRPRQGLPPSHQRNLMKLFGEDLTKVREKDPKRVIARAMQALMGAAQLDGGQEVAEKVMTELKLLIRYPRA
jgi:dsRNA-specific ribonuclease